jgi:hypothetical protein
MLLQKPQVKDEKTGFYEKHFIPDVFETTLPKYRAILLSDSCGGNMPRSTCVHYVSYMSMRYMGLITGGDCHHQWPCDNAELITYSQDAKKQA